MASTPSVRAGKLDVGRSGVDVERRLDWLIEQYGAFLRSTIARFCPRDLGLQLDEIEQEARIRLWRALQREREIDDPPSYLYRIAASATIDAVRRVRARREISVAPAEDEDTESTTLVAPTPSPDRVAARAELRTKVETALAPLATNRRRAVGLYLQGFTSTEIADLLGWCEAKARNLLYRGLRDLRRGLRSLGVTAADAQAQT